MVVKDPMDKYLLRQDQVVAWEAIPAGGVDGIVSSANATAITIDSAETIFHKTTSPTLHSAVTGIVFENGSLLNDVTRGDGKSITLAQNLAIDSGNTWTYLAAGEGSYYQQFNGNHYFGTAVSGSAGADATVNTKMLINSAGNVGIGVAPNTSRLKVEQSVSSEWAMNIKHASTGVNYGLSIETSAGATNDVGALQVYTPSGGGLIFTNRSRLGIGTSSPDHTLHVLSGSASMAEFASSNASPFINFARSGARTAYIQLHEPGATGTSQLRFGTGSSHNPTTSMTIDENNNVGIGTSSPLDLLHIQGGGYDQIRIGSNFTDNTNKTAGIVSTTYTNQSVSLFQMFNQNGSNALYYGSADGAHRGINQHYFYTNSNYNSTSGHKLRYLINGTGKHTFYGKHQGDSVGHFLFTNNSSGEDATNTNCTLAVQNGGTFIQIMGWTTLGARIGTRTGGWNSNSGGDVYFTRQDATSIKLASSGPQLGNGTAISSDERLKENITDIADGQLAKICALTPRNFTWKDTRKTGTNEGFIAQEVEAVIPEAVFEDNFAPDPDDDSRDFDGDIKLIKHEVINARLIKAVQELSAKLEAAEARITTLEG